MKVLKSSFLDPTLSLPSREKDVRQLTDGMGLENKTKRYFFTRK